MTPSRNSRSYILRSVPSSPGRSFLQYCSTKLQTSSAPAQFLLWATLDVFLFCSNIFISVKSLPGQYCKFVMGSFACLWRQNFSSIRENPKLSSNEFNHLATARQFCTARTNFSCTKENPKLSRNQFNHLAGLRFCHVARPARRKVQRSKPC